jgi:hypothetical protein
MKTVLFTVRFPFQFGQNVEVVFDEQLELLLDCATCQKKGRTVVIYPVKEASFCTPTDHPYSAQIIDFTVTRYKGTTEALYKVAYSYTAFKDTRDKWNFDPFSQEMPTWGRVHFTITCPSCNQQKQKSTQTNIVRPWKCYCHCGYLFYEEMSTIPLFERIPP